METQVFSMFLKYKPPWLRSTPLPAPLFESMPPGTTHMGGLSAIAPGKRQHVVVIMSSGSDMIRISAPPIADGQLF
jgi:hypothetical protein